MRGNFVLPAREGVRRFARLDDGARHLAGNQHRQQRCAKEDDDGDEHQLRPQCRDGAVQRGDDGVEQQIPARAVGEGDAARAQQALLLVVLHLRHVAAELMAVVLVAAEWGDVEQLRQRIAVFGNHRAPEGQIPAAHAVDEAEMNVIRRQKHMLAAVQQENADVILLREPVHQRGQLIIADVALHRVGCLGDLPRFIPAVEVVQPDNLHQPQEREDERDKRRQVSENSAANAGMLFFFRIFAHGETPHGFRILPQSTRGRSMQKSPTQSRGRVKGGTPLQGQRPCRSPETEPLAPPLSLSQSGSQRL